MSEPEQAQIGLVNEFGVKVQIPDQEMISKCNHDDFGSQVWDLLPVDPENRQPSSALTEVLKISRRYQSAEVVQIMVDHRSDNELKESRVILVHPGNKFARPFDVDNTGKLSESARSCEDNKVHTSMNELVGSFCQNIQLLENVTEEGLFTAAMLLQHLFKAWQGDLFQKDHQWPFGIQSLALADTEKSSLVLRNAFNRQQYPVRHAMAWGLGQDGELVAHIDTLMRTHGYFQCVIRPKQAVQKLGKPYVENKNYAFTLVLIVKFDHPDFLDNFGRKGFDFHLVAIIAWFSFLSAKDCIGSKRHRKRSKTIKENRERYLKATVPVTDEYVAQRRETVKKSQDDIISVEEQKMGRRGRKRKTPYPEKELSVDEDDKEEQQESNPSPELTESENLQQYPNTLKAFDTEFPKLPTSAQTSTSYTSSHKPIDPDPKNIDDSKRIVSAMDFSATTSSLPHDQTQQTNMSQPNESTINASQPSMQSMTSSSTPAQTKLPPSPSKKSSKCTRSLLSPIQEKPVESLLLKIDHLELSPERDAQRADSTVQSTTAVAANSDTETPSSQASTPSPKSNTEETSTDNTPSEAEMGKKKNKIKQKSQETSGLLPSIPEDQPQSFTTSTTSAAPPISTPIVPVPPTNSTSLSNIPRNRRKRRTKPSQVIPSLQSAPVLFSYNFDNAITRCWLPFCHQRTASHDGKTVMCPRCGERSYVRYCSTSHLHLDFNRHYQTGECKHRENPLLIDEATMTPLRKPRCEFIDVENPALYDSLERVRQAIYHSQPPVVAEREGGDYFVFSDVDNLLAGEPDDGSVDVRAPDVLAKYRGTGGVVVAVEFEEGSEKKLRFGGVLEQCLRLGYAAGRENVVACGLLFVWLKEELRAMGVWDDRMVTRMCFAMQLEFGYKPPQHLCTV